MLSGSAWLSDAKKKELLATTKKLCQNGKGILAADETPEAMTDRFGKIGLENTFENRRLYRQLLFSVSKKENLGSHLSGVILNQETILDQKLQDGRSFIEAINAFDGCVVGVTLDKGWRPIPSCPGEVFTQGMNDIADRAAKFRELGCRFAKWRMVVVIDKENKLPSDLAISEGVRELALYASVCQANGLVPIVEPDISREGTFTIEEMQNVFERVNVELYKALNDYNVFLEGTILKCSMVNSGTKCAKLASTDQVANLTLESLRKTVPVVVPGIFYLSNGMTDTEATANLNAMNLRSPTARPWHISFSFGRALQAEARKKWSGKEANVSAAQKAFVKRVALNGAAVRGEYKSEMEN